MIVVNDFEQGSPEWFAARAGIPSASCFDKIVTSTGARSSQRKAYLYQLVGERMLGTKAETYTTAAMERGIELEAQARGLYEMVYGTSVYTVAMCYKDDEKKFSCSPDGLIGHEKGLEIKCPLLHTHVEYMHKGKLPTKYLVQVQGSLLVTGMSSWDFVSYFPGMDLFKVTVEPDIDFHKKLESELGKFCDELEHVYDYIKNNH